MSKFYVGRKAGSVSRFVFKSESEPTQASHGHLYSSVIGPFRSKRAANWMALFGNNNPHLQTVSDAERISKQQ